MRVSEHPGGEFQPSPSQPRSKRPVWIVGGVAAILVLCCIVAMAASFFGGRYLSPQATNTPTRGDHVSYQYCTSDHDSNPDVGTYANPDPNAAADPGAQVYGNAHSCAWGGCACRVFF